MDKVEVKLNASYEVRGGGLRAIVGKPSVLIGVPYDRPVVGYGGKTVNTLRLWAASATDYFDFQVFSHGEFVGAVAETLEAMSLTRVLYPDDSTSMGQGLRFVQEYFLVACSLADLIRRFRRSGADWGALPDKVAIQMNDTHPSLSVPELMRILLDEAHLGWDQAWDLTQRTLAYTNHTLLPEALEKWPLAWFEALLPRHLEIIFEINRRLLEAVRARYPGDVGRVQRISLIEGESDKHIRMANLAIVGSHSTNGVAAIHSELLRTTTVKDLAEMFPDRFSNKTNGVTPRRWLLLANPSVAGWISRAIGDSWVTNLTELTRLQPLAGDKSLRDSYRVAKREAKIRFATWLSATLGLTVDPESMFDCQVKRIHEYKRQLLNALRIVVLYNRMRSKPPGAVRTANLYLRGQSRACLPTGEADHQVHPRSGGHDRLRSGGPRPHQSAVPSRVRCVPGGSAHSRQRRLQPDIDSRLRGQRHEQHEVHDERRPDTRHPGRGNHRDGRGSGRGELFPLRADRGGSGRQPRWYKPALALRTRGGNACRAGPDRLRALQPRRHRIYTPLIDTLLTNGDHYMHLADLTSYLAADERVRQLYANPDEWARKAILNIAGSGKFSSDRTIAEYAQGIWRTPPCPVVKEPV